MKSAPEKSAAGREDILFITFSYSTDMSPNTMTITTYDLTFSYFFIYLLLRQCGNKFHNICMLFTTDVVKIHDIVWIKLPTVSTRRVLLKVSDISSQMSLLLGYRELFGLHPR